MRRLIPLLLLAACGGDPYEGWPDLRGRYNIQIGRTEGCAAAPQHVSWAAGPMQIRGEQPDLEFILGNDRVFEGSTTETGRFTFRGTTQGFDDVIYDVDASGLSTGSPTEWMLDGQISVSFEGDEDVGCVYTGVFTAPQVGE